MKRFRLITLPISEEAIEEIRERNVHLSKEDLETAIESVRETGKLSFKKILQVIMRSPLDSHLGVSIEEMEESLGILKKLKEVKEGDILELEEDQWRYLVRKLDAFKANVFDERLITLSHTVKNATADVLDEVP